MTLDLDAIEARAISATPGPWKFTRNAIGTRWWMLTPDDSDKYDMEHIAGMDPTTTLVLIAEVRKLREALETISNLHLPSQPAAYDCDLADPTRKHHTALRLIARIALIEEPNA